MSLISELAYHLCAEILREKPPPTVIVDPTPPILRLDATPDRLHRDMVCLCGDDPALADLAVPLDEARLLTAGERPLAIPDLPGPRPG